MISLSMRLVVNCVRGWTWLYTWRMPPALRATRRAEIASDLWEWHDDAGDHSLGFTLQILLRVLIGIPDDIGWRVEQAVVTGTLAQKSIALGGRVAGAAFIMCALWAIDADASRQRPDMAITGPAAVFDQDIEGSTNMRAGNVPRLAGKRLPLLTAGIVATVGVSMQLAAQSSPGVTSGPVFEVVSIKPNPTRGTGPTRSQVQPGGRFVAENIPVRLLIGQAYQVPSYRLVGGPSWITSESFDIDARANGELSARGGPRPLDGALQGLLAVRFKLVVHTETRQLPICTLAMARSDGRLGPNLTRSSITDCAPVLAAVLAAPGGGPPPPGGGGPPAPPAPGGLAQPCSVMTGIGRFSANSRSPSQLAAIISAMVERRVVDQTGLTGLFNAQLTWTPDQIPPRLDPNAPPIDPNGPSLFTAVQEQLGLKLESTTGPVDVIVIDSVEHPTPN
jgi:uncharacterized protein (TIGR03435 family)